MKSLSILLFCTFIHICSCSLPVEICPTFSCNPNEQDTIQFPFHVPRNQSSRCGYPGFDLTCGRNGQTLLDISSRTLIVRGIDYGLQALVASEPNSCIPNLVLNHDLNLTSTPYDYGPYSMTYIFFNCSRNDLSSRDRNALPMFTSTVACLSGADYTVMATFKTESEEEMVKEMDCKVIKRVTTAFWWPESSDGFNYPLDLSLASLRLSWAVPSCGDCIIHGGYCGFASDGVRDVVCFLPPDSGLSRGAKYGLMLGVGIPAILCMIGLTYYISSKARTRRTQNQSTRYPTTEFSPAIFPQPVIVTVGLDRPTIESYPKTILGESKRLPKTSDGMCPICLSEYQPKETLRAIPECNHYFHADCIDEWLRMNVTCPLCRKSPQQPSAAAAG